MLRPIELNDVTTPETEWLDMRGVSFEIERLGAHQICIEVKIDAQKGGCKNAPDVVRYRQHHAPGD